MVTYTNDQIADQLSDVAWTSQGHIRHSWASNTVTVNISALNADGQFFALNALDAWSENSNITFVLTASASADIVFDDEQAGAVTNSSWYTPSGDMAGATINISKSWIVGDEGDLSTYSFQTYIHEIGHALGLGHAGQYDGTATYGVDNHYDNDSWQATVMSYFSQTENTSITASYAYIFTPMTADILAMQTLYGVDTTVREGNTVYGVGSTTGGYLDGLVNHYTQAAFTLHDTGGIDTVNFSTDIFDQVVTLVDETYSSVGGLIGNMTIFRGTVIENFIAGLGNDDITGNDAANILNGGAGNDDLHGGAGNDTLIAGTGIDWIRGDAGIDTVDYSLAGAGADIYLNLGKTKGAEGTDYLKSIENATGSAFDDRLIGSTGTNTLIGGAGNDVMKSKGGDDQMYGGDGDDRMVGYTGNEFMSGGNGVDVMQGISGNDIMYGGAGNDYMYGGADNDIVYGGAGADKIYGNTGNDILYGSEIGLVDLETNRIYGGNGSDTIYGGDGLDYLYGENADDVIIGGKGDDRVWGGSGSDTFVFSMGDGADRIKDFENGLDKIDLSTWGFATFNDVLALVTGYANSLSLDFADGSSILVSGLTADIFDATDVLL